MGDGEGKHSFADVSEDFWFWLFAGIGVGEPFLDTLGEIGGEVLATGEPGVEGDGRRSGGLGGGGLAFHGRAFGGNYKL